MASAPVVPETSATTAPAKVPMMQMMMVMILMVVLTIGGVAGTLLYMSKAGKLGGGGTAKVAEVIEKDKLPTHPLVLEPMLVNLADADGHSYLRIGVTLEVEDPPKDGKKKEEKEAKPTPGADAGLRDTVLEVLGQQKAADLLGPTGKDRLKSELKGKLAEQVPETKVSQVYFTEFLVQR